MKHAANLKALPEEKPEDIPKLVDGEGIEEEVGGVKPPVPYF